jgi:hypothetical protein
VPSGLALRASDNAEFDLLLQRVEDSGVQTWVKEKERAFLCGVSSPVTRRAVLCRPDEAPELVGSLRLGRMLIVRDSVDADEQQVFASHLLLEKTGLDGCGRHEQAHWGVREPHRSSADATIDRAFSAFLPTSR